MTNRCPCRWGVGEKSVFPILMQEYLQLTIDVVLRDQMARFVHLPFLHILSLYFTLEYLLLE